MFLRKGVQACNQQARRDNPRQLQMMDFKIIGRGVFLILLLVLFVPSISAWSLNNFQDFSGYLCNSSNASTVLIDEVAVTKNFLFADAYSKNYTNETLCDSMIRASYHYLDFYEPDCSCPENFHDFAHEYWESWNWGFDNCGLKYQKTELLELLDDFRNDFLNATLSEPVKEYIIEENTTTMNQSQEVEIVSESLLGGLSFQPSLDFFQNPINLIVLGAILFIFVIISYILISGVSKVGFLLVLGLEIIVVLDKSFFLTLIGVGVLEIIVLMISIFTSMRFSEGNSSIQNLSRASTPWQGQKRGYKFSIKYSLYFFIGLNVGFWVLYGIYLWIG